MLRSLDLAAGLAVMINSPGGSGLAAERIINVLRSYSGTGEYWAIDPAKAKSAATMVCLGASKIVMGSVSELGPVDPQYPRRTLPENSMSKSDEDRAEKRRNAQQNYERIMKTIEPFIPQPDKPKLPSREVWRHGDSIPASRQRALPSRASPRGEQQASEAPAVADDKDGS